jgi:hypothetical protein
MQARFPNFESSWRAYLYSYVGRNPHLYDCPAEKEEVYASAKPPKVKQASPWVLGQFAAGEIDIPSGLGAVDVHWLVGGAPPPFGRPAGYENDDDEDDDRVREEHEDPRLLGHLDGHLDGVRDLAVVKRVPVPDLGDDIHRNRGHLVFNPVRLDSAPREHHPRAFATTYYLMNGIFVVLVINASLLFAGFLFQTALVGFKVIEMSLQLLAGLLLLAQCVLPFR